MAEKSTELKWQKSPPRIAGHWFVSEVKRKRRQSSMVEVQFDNHRWEWSFLDGMTWNDTDAYPKYEWAGPILPPA